MRKKEWEIPAFANVNADKTDYLDFLNAMEKAKKRIEYSYKMRKVSGFITAAAIGLFVFSILAFMRVL